MKFLGRAILVRSLAWAFSACMLCAHVDAAQSQTIEFTPPSVVTWSSAPLLLTARASSGLPVTFSVVSGPASVDGNQLFLTASGNVRVRAEQAGNDQYLSAAVERNIVVQRSMQLLQWPGLPEGLLAINVPQKLEATATSGLPVTFRVEAGPARIEDGFLIITNIGALRLVAEQVGDARYSPVSIGRNYNLPSGVKFTALGEWPGYARGEAVDVKVQGNYAYLAAGKTGFMVVNIENIQNPVHVAIVPMGEAVALDLEGNFAYVVDVINGIAVLDITDPTNPRQVAVIPGNAIEVVNGKAYISADFNLNILDVSNPADIRVLGSLANAGGMGLAVEGGFAYVAFGSTLRVVDISNAAAPIMRGTLSLAADIYGVAAQGTIVYLAAMSHGLRIVDASDPTTPMLVGQQNAGYLVQDVAVRESIAYVSSYDGILTVLDVSNPFAPRPLDTHHSKGSALRLSLSGNYAFVARQQYGLEIVDVTLPLDIKPVTSYKTYGWAYRVIRAGNYAYVADGPAGVQVIDVRNPQAPVRVANYQAKGAATHMVLENNVGYIVADDLEIVDFTNPGAPVKLGQFHDGHLIYPSLWVAVKDGYAYLTTETELLLLDVRNPANPQTIGRLGEPARVSIFGDYALVGAGLYDVSIPPNLVRITDLPYTPFADVELDGNFIYSTYPRLDNNLEVFDITNPATPQTVGRATIPGDGGGIAHSGGTLYVAAASPGMHVVDVTIPSFPRLLSTFNTSGAADDVAVSGRYAYIADGTEGLKVVEAIVTFPQVVYFNPPAEVPITASPLILEAYASSGLPVTFSFRGGPALLQGNRLTLTGTGAVTIRARQLGNDQFPAVTVDRTITVLPAPPQVLVREATGGKLEFYWPAGDAAYQLQRTDSLSPANWQNVTDGVVLEGGQYKTQMDPVGAQGYFRLVKL